MRGDYNILHRRFGLLSLLLRMLRLLTLRPSKDQTASCCILQIIMIVSRERFTFMLVLKICNTRVTRIYYLPAIDRLLQLLVFLGRGVIPLYICIHPSCRVVSVLMYLQCFARVYVSCNRSCEIASYFLPR